MKPVERLLDLLLDDVLSVARSGGARFELVTGPRGSGKSHLLALVSGRLTGHPKAPVGLQVVALDEEEHVSSLADLLTRLLRRVDPDDPSIHRQIDLMHQAGADAAVDLGFEFLRQRLGDQPAVLMLENLDSVFDAIGLVGQQRLRSELQEAKRWSVVATSPRWGPMFSQRDRPFFGTFNQRKLSPLTAEDCRELLVRLALADKQTDLAQMLSSPLGLARVRALRHLTGGIPLAMVLAYRHLNTETLDAVESAFFALADALTPYYQAQMAALSAGQRALVECLAENWRPLSVSELAQRTFNTPQTTSGLLRDLVRDHGLISVMPFGRNRFYEISEPLLRIARVTKGDDEAPAVLARSIRAMYADLADGVRGAALAMAIAHLPDDIEPYIRLAREERAAVRELLSTQDGADLLAGLPPEPEE